MLTTSILPVLSLASLFLSASSAPTRSDTICRCTIVDTSKTWTTSIPSTLDSSNSNSDICASLGPHLENAQDSNSNPDQQSAEETPVATPTDDDLQPLSTTVLLQNTQSNLEHLGVVLPSAPTKRPQAIIVCYPEPESFSAYQDSRTTIFALNVIVAMVILACIVEGYILASDMIERRKTKNRTLRLSGAERLLRAPIRADLECIFSPGAEKKMRVYESPEWVERITPSDKRFATAYLVTIAEEDDDDEMSRPVM